MTKRLLPLSLCLALVGQTIGAQSLYHQTVSQRLIQNLSGGRVSYLLLDSQSRAIISAHWEDSGHSVPMGSLVKPFTALAFGETHGFRYPEFTCLGTTQQCWLPSGHGRIGLAGALAYSCNAYFRMLAFETTAAQVSAVMRRLGILGASEGASTETLIGLGDDWRVEPAALARAYCELVSRTAEPGAIEVLRGMRLSARIGTGRAVDEALAGTPALAKTGTAPCVHTPRRKGDGYVIILYPADSPRLALLVRVHGVPGAEAAAIGGHMLRATLP